MGIKRIAFLMPSAAFALLLVWAPAAPGEEPRASLEIELKLLSKPPLVLLLPSPEIVQTDTARAISEIRARERLDELIQEMIQGPRRRPDLHYDVWSGIQSRNISNALRR